MRPFWKKVEEINSKLILPAIFILLVIIIYQLFSPQVQNEKLEITLQVLDSLVVAIFVIDLIFLAIKAKSTKFFFKNYWLDILAVLPIYFFFKIFTRFYTTVTLTEEIVLGQRIVHEGLEVEKEVKILSRGGRLARSVGIGTRVLRVLIKSRFLSMFLEKYHLAHKRTYQANEQRYKISRS
ncbi:hypothetical protein J4421_05320 [Candidatus Woesearchaeota archaeon]|nr:hypothetical protein [Candidatus Woesearchaeota archaeon]